MSGNSGDDVVTGGRWRDRLYGCMGDDRLGDADRSRDRSAAARGRDTATTGRRDTATASASSGPEG